MWEKRIARSRVVMREKKGFKTEQLMKQSIQTRVWSLESEDETDDDSHVISFVLLLTFLPTKTMKREEQQRHKSRLKLVHWHEERDDNYTGFCVKAQRNHVEVKRKLMPDNEKTKHEKEKEDALKSNTYYSCISLMSNDSWCLSEREIISSHPSLHESMLKKKKSWEKCWINAISFRAVGNDF